MARLFQKLDAISTLPLVLTGYLVLCSVFVGFSQNIKATVNTQNVKLGEQLMYTIEVSQGNLPEVVFPKNESLLPWQVSSDLPVDTLKNNNHVILKKTYGILAFEDGTFNIPKQKLTISGKPYILDSIRIEVAKIKTDTVSKKIYDIKPHIKVKDKSVLGAILLWGSIALGVLLVAALVYFLLKRRKSKADKTALLEPYEKAQTALKNLENSKYLIQGEHKRFYSELTDILRTYIEEETEVEALESTTDQLLEILQTTNVIKLQKEILAEFSKVLKNADLVKFAKLVPESKAAEQDRLKAEKILFEIKASIPKPDESETQEDLQTLNKVGSRKHRKKVALLVATGVLVLGLVLLGIFMLEDRSTKGVLKTEWVKSQYSYPPISIETPYPLKRVSKDKSIYEKDSIVRYDWFDNDQTKIGLYIALSQKVFSKNTQIQSEDQLLGELPKQMSALGMKNIVTKSEAYKLKNGKDGLKVFGTMDFRREGIVKSCKYLILNTFENGALQQLLIVYNADDTYADQVVYRILNSLEFKLE